MYISMYTRDELAAMPRKEALTKLGIVSEEEVVQPPPCRFCQEPAILVSNSDLGSDFIQCSSCGRYSKAYLYQDTFFKKKE